MWLEILLLIVSIISGAFAVLVNKAILIMCSHRDINSEEARLELARWFIKWATLVFDVLEFVISIVPLLLFNYIIYSSVVYLILKIRWSHSTYLDSLND
jgi:hypothetical protein